MANLVAMMKQKVAQSGGSRKEILFFKEGTVKRIRFLQELDEGETFKFHSDFNLKLYTLCEDPEENEDCPYCKSGIGLKDEFAWTVWDYDSNEVKIFKCRVTSQSPAPALIEMFEEFGTIMDRDYKIKKVGKGTGSSYVVTPLDKEKFRGGKAKPYTRDEMLEIFKKAYNTDMEDDDEEVEEKPAKTKGKERSKRRTPTLQELYEEFDWPTIKGIALDLGMTKKEIKSYDKDVESLVADLFDSYEEDDLQEIYDNLDDEEGDEE